MHEALRTYSVVEYFPLTRVGRLQQELHQALGQLESKELWALAGMMLSHGGKSTVRRGKALLNVTSGLVSWAAKEGMSLARSTGQKDGLSQYLQQAGQRTQVTASQTASWLSRQSSVFKAAFQANPTETLSDVVVGVLMFSLVGGGLDGNGGLPDTDLALGGGWHRSPLTHSILAGVAVEVLLVGTCEFVSKIHGYLPEQHDPLWDSVLSAKNRIARAAMTGTSTGLAYHLMADAIVQPGAYHGLPAHMPMEAHQTIMGSNAVAEMADIKRHQS